MVATMVIKTHTLQNDVEWRPDAASEINKPSEKELTLNNPSSTAGEPLLAGQ